MLTHEERANALLAEMQERVTWADMHRRPVAPDLIKLLTAVFAEFEREIRGERKSETLPPAV